MPHLHLPAEHDDADIAMAAAIARALRSSELYVAWSSGAGLARPVLRAQTPAPAPRRRRRLRARLARRRRA